MPNIRTRRLVLRRAAARNGLLNALVAYWPGNEASGNALDAHTNALHLTAVNNPGSGTGLVYPLARQYTRSSGTRHQRSSEALLNIANADFTFAVWARFTTIDGFRWLLEKRVSSDSTKIEYQLVYGPSSGLAFTLSNGTNNVDVRSGIHPTVDQWYLIVGWHQHGVLVGIQVNEATTVSEPWTGGAQNTNAPFFIGAASWNVTLSHDGLIGPTAFWKSAPGGGGALTAAQRAALWNGGAGLRYDQFTM